MVVIWLVATESLATTAEAADAMRSGHKTFWELYQQGGFMMWVMLGVSMFALSLILESAMRLRANAVVPPEEFDELKALIRQGNYQETWNVVTLRSSPFSRVVAAGMEVLGQGKEAVREALEEHALKEALMMRTRVNYLSVIGVVSPMLGLIGTVVGMIKAFQAISSMFGNPGALAEAIGEVLVATAFGLFIAVPSFFAYYFFRNRVQRMIVLMQDKVTRLMRALPYRELEGIQIGPDLEEGQAVADSRTPFQASAIYATAPAATVSVRCPNCAQPITPGASPCPSCGVELQWT